MSDKYPDIPSYTVYTAVYYTHWHAVLYGWVTNGVRFTLFPQYLFTYMYVRACLQAAVVLVVACAWVTITESQTIDHLIYCPGQTSA